MPPEFDTTALSILLVEDNPTDAELTIREFKREGILVDVTVVDDLDSVADHMRWTPPDVVLSDFGFPTFSGFDVLDVVREHTEDTPFILLSGTIGEERAVDALQKGATDVVLKDNLARLIPAVERAIKEVDEKREKDALEERLRQMQRLDSIGRLAGGIAHDFNNVLMVISTNAQLLLQRDDLDDEVRTDIEDILEASNRATGLTRQLLVFSRRSVISPKIVDINDTVVELGKMIGRILGADIELAVIPEPDLWKTKIDVAQLEQVLMNLVTNARDAMPSGGKLTIETANVRLDSNYASRHMGVQPGHYVRLTVTDTGVGIEQEHLDHLFEPFYTTKSEGTGTGLGLATCYGIVKRIRGNIWIYSEPGIGTSVKVYFPRAETQSPSPATQAAEPQKAKSLGGTETILLAEDEPSVIALVARTLRSQGYHVRMAMSGEAAIQEYEAATPSMDRAGADGPHNHDVRPRSYRPQRSDRCRR